MEPLDLSLPADFDNPPSIISVDLRRRLQRRFEAAQRLAADPGQIQAVHGLLGLCVATDPGNALFARAWVANLRRGRLKNHWLAPWTPLVRRRAITSAAAARAWGKVLREALQWLFVRPGDDLGPLQLAAACHSLGHAETRILWLELATELHPRSTAALRELAEAYSAAGQFSAAAQVWRALAKLSPGDPAAPNSLPAPQPILPVPEAASEQAPRTSQEAVARLKKLLSSHQLEAAAELLARLGGALGGDLEIRWFAEELEIATAVQRVELGRRQAEEKASAENLALLQSLLSEQKRIELGVWFARYERFPTNRNVLREMALRLKAEGNYAEAARYFEQFSQQPPGGESPVELAHLEIAWGECLQYLRKFTAALAAYQAAILRLPASQLQESTDASSRETAKLSRYRGAVLAEALGELASARLWLGEISAADPSYKDARSRLDKLPPICDKV